MTRKLKKAEIENYQPAEFFSFYSFGKPEAGGFFKRNPSYRVSLMTHDYYDEKYYQIKETVHSIEAELSDDFKVG